MECSRGSICVESTHKVKTYDMAQAWCSDVQVSDLPVTIQQFTASGGRVLIRIFDKDGSLIYSKG